MSDPKTNNPVPLWYKVTVEFSDGEETVVEPWNGKEYADSAVRAWKKMAEAEGFEVTVTVVPKYTPRPPD